MNEYNFSDYEHGSINTSEASSGTGFSLQQTEEALPSRSDSYSLEEEASSTLKIIKRTDLVGEGKEEKSLREF